MGYCGLQILIIIGTKLEHVIMEMAQEIQDRTTIVRGAPVVEPNNKYFWFNRPHWILFFIHYILFQVLNPNSTLSISTKCVYINIYMYIYVHM